MYLKFTETPQKPTLAEGFYDNLCFFVVQEIMKHDLDTEEVFPLMADLPVDFGHFNPLEHWEFRHIFSYDVNQILPPPSRKNITVCLVGLRSVYSKI
ncbi:MAG: hypothetical protein R3Y63_11195 [Eubacteriales bacterium]